MRIERSYVAGHGMRYRCVSTGGEVIVATGGGERIGVCLGGTGGCNAC